MMTVDFGLQIAMALAGVFGGIWLKRLQDDIKSLQLEQREIMRDLNANYQSKMAAQRDVETIKELISEVKQQLTRIDTKLDRKADK